MASIRIRRCRNKPEKKIKSFSRQANQFGNGQIVNFKTEPHTFHRCFGCEWG